MVVQKNTYSTLKVTVNGLIIALAITSQSWAQNYIAPPMVNIPGGEFIMGSDSGDARAKPAHRVTVSNFQMAKYPVTVAEFRAFVEDSGFKPHQTCNDLITKNWFSGPGTIGSASWDKHRFQNNDYQPVTCVTWQEANAYADWLSKKTGTHYRLPTDQEFEYALKANTTSRYFWGDDPNMTQACMYGNFADQSGEYFASKEYGASYVGFLEHANCDDGEAYNSIVGLYRPNPFGLYDMAGNVGQLLGNCYYDGYDKRTLKEMDLSECEYISHRGETWHFPPQNHVDRFRSKRLDPTGWALQGFRLAAIGNNNTEASTTHFETALKKAQIAHLTTRPKIPLSPQHLILTKIDSNTDDNYQLSWQANDSPAVTGYEVYQSKLPSAHLLSGFFKEYYTKIQTVEADINTLRVSQDAMGSSYKVVTITDTLTSLPSQAAFVAESPIVSLPGRVNMQDNVLLENVRLAYREAKDDKPGYYYLTKFNNGFEQLLVTATFNVNVNNSAWYKLNYRGSTMKKGEFFKLWQNNVLLATINYDPEVDDKTSNTHKVFLEKGSHSLQLNVLREGFDIWHINWLEFTEITKG
jgi:formylglycine-generating enzyme required for sulfatase activity